MRNVAILAALMLAVALPSTSQAAAKKKAAVDPAVAAQQNTAALIRDAMNPFEASKPKPAAKKGKKSAKM